EGSRLDAAGGLRAATRLRCNLVVLSANSSANRRVERSRERLAREGSRLDAAGGLRAATRLRCNLVVLSANSSANRRVERSRERLAREGSRLDATGGLIGCNQVALQPGCGLALRAVPQRAADLRDRDSEVQVLAAAGDEDADDVSLLVDRGAAG